MFPLPPPAIMPEVTRSNCHDVGLTPNDWREYVDAHTNELLHIDEFYSPEDQIKVNNYPPPGDWTKKVDIT